MRAMTMVTLVAVLTLAACRTTNPGVPPGYVSVKSGGDTLLQAVAPTGNRLRVCRHETPPEGTLAFWREAIERELTVGRGYEPVESKAVTGRMPGHEMLFEVTRPEGPYLYLVTIRMDGRDVVVSEAGGEKHAMVADLAGLRAAMR